MQPTTAGFDAIRESYRALNRGDVSGFVRLFDADIDRVEEFSGFTCHGLAAVTQHVASGRGTWAEGGCEPQRFAAVGHQVIVFVDVRVRLKTETDWRQGRTVDIYTFRDGKVIEFRTFGDEHEAMRWLKSEG